MNDLIKCEIDGAMVHSVQVHLHKHHPDWTIERYQETYPAAPVLSEKAKALIAQKKAERATVPAVAVTPVEGTSAAFTESVKQVPLHEAFGLTDTRETRSARGSVIPVDVLTPKQPDMVPEVDPNYVHDPEFVRNALMALALNIPMYVWGHAGTGKTTGVEQIAARTGRELLRVQHTINTEESHIVGQWVARGGETHFEHGPLAMAMKNGWIYLADEYDFALPSVLSVYQPVLEGKPLVIKEADQANRIVRPHPNFRFVATGNTNGSGDETGLYQGTNIQNAANFDRFHMVLEVKYMSVEKEQLILINQTKIDEADAKKLVEFGRLVRESYDGNKIASPISPRSLIAAAAIGKRKGSYRAGISVSFANKLSRVDKEVVDGLAARIFG